ncbi:beta-galactosidase [Paenibacillus sp. ACRSA]|uniref:beta-galactosidase n=1 Tax=Paenibacillus sp. ACRSA TaxID=2918211 RepID=UPI001EF46297|nr:beta-galactosidase [Paenibacillus sp. ACRSA]MCG7376529.1 beta-galactosidase [Paenibacillus sp. ACRSA]
MRNSIAENHIHLSLNEANKEIQAGRMTGNGGQNPQGESYDFTNFYMTRNDKPYIPVVGEFHFSRFAYLQWEEELLKMKAGGVNIVASYVFWNFHEEEEGIFNWSGNLNLRHFVDLCSKHKMPLIMRIGPFCHGEVRNGGIPDWLFSYPLEVRSNDPAYLHYAKRLYREIAHQLKGAYFQEGGPIIGVQLENEYMHAGAPLDAWGYKSGKYLTAGRDGKEHLTELRRIAEQVGIKPLFYTATAWGGAAVPSEGTLPMLAGYAYTPWIPNQPPSREFLFRDLHVNPVESVDYNSQEYPAAYCELAGGMQVSYHARPLVDADSVEAMTVVKLASGSNLVGYYMYHGGSNPIGKKSYMNEQALPKITYDYQSPIGEFGRIAASYDRIRILSMFLDAYGEMLAPMGSVIPEDQAEITSDNTTNLRWAVRQHCGSGFLFLNNYQDHVQMPDRDVRIELSTTKGNVSFPNEGSLKLRSRRAAILPFHMPLSGLEVISATVQPLTQFVTNDEVTVVFYELEGIQAEYVLAASSVEDIDAANGVVNQDEERYVIHPVVGLESDIQLTSQDGVKIRIITLTREQALQSYRLNWGGEERILISRSRLLISNDRLVCTSEGVPQIEVSMYPAPNGTVLSNLAQLSQTQHGIFKTFQLNIPSYDPSLQVEHPKEHTAIINIDTDWPTYVDDVFVQIDYEGDVAEAYIHNRMLTDHIQYGEPWRIGLKESLLKLSDHALRIMLTPVRKGTTTSYVNQAFIEKFEGTEIGVFHQIEAIPYYRVSLNLK